MAKRFWIRWYTLYPKDTPFPSWTSGYRCTDDAAVMLALVDADSEETAIKTVRRKFRNMELDSCDEKPLTWTPGDRFPMQSGTDSHD